MAITLVDYYTSDFETYQLNNNITSDSISVQAGDIIVVFATCENDSDFSSNDIQFSDTQSNTYTEREVETGLGGDGVYARISTAVAGISGSLTVTGNPDPAGTSYWGMCVMVFRGAIVGIHDQAENYGGWLPTINIATSNANSAIVACVSDWGATAGTSTFDSTDGTPVEVADSVPTGKYGIHVAYYLDMGGSGTKTVGMTAPSGQDGVIFALVLDPITLFDELVYSYNKQPSWSTDSVTSSSFNANAGDLLVVMYGGQGPGFSGYSQPEMSVTSAGMTFTCQIGSDDGRSDPNYPLFTEIHTGIVPTTASRTVTLDAVSGTDNWGGWFKIYKFSGVNTSIPIRQAKANTLDYLVQSDGAYTWYLNGDPLSTSVVLAVITDDCSYSGTLSQVPGSGWSELFDEYLIDGGGNFGTFQCQIRPAGSTSNTISYADLNDGAGSPNHPWAFAAIEIAAEGGPPLSISSSSVALDSRSGSITVTAPSGIQDGDILIGGMLLFDWSSQIAGATPPSGFSLIDTSSIDNPISVNKSGSEYMDYYLYWKRASSESGDYTFTFTGTSDYCQAFVGCYRGALSTGSPFDVASDNSGVGSTTTFTGVTTTANNTLLIGTSFDWGDETNNLSPPTGFFEREDITQIYLCDKAKESFGSTGNFTMTNNSWGGDPWGAFLLALLPESEVNLRKRFFTIVYT